MQGSRVGFTSPLACLVWEVVRFELMFFDDLCNSAFGAFDNSGLLWIVDVLLEGHTLHMRTRKGRILCEVKST